MRLRDRLLYHQIHPAKVATDLSAGALSLYLLWHGKSKRALLVVGVPPAVASAVLICCADLTPYRTSPAGRYIRRFINAPAHAVRFAAFGSMMVGAWRHDVRLFMVGGVGLLVSWFYGIPIVVAEWRKA